MHIPTRHEGGSRIALHMTWEPHPCGDFVARVREAGMLGTSIRDPVLRHFLSCCGLLKRSVPLPASSLAKDVDHPCQPQAAILPVVFQHLFESVRVARQQRFDNRAMLFC